MLVPRDSRPFFEACGEPGLTLCHVSFWIWRTVPFILMAIGTCGNILSMIVLSRKRLRRLSTTVYLLVLTCSDLTLLWTAVLREVLMYVFRFEINAVSDFHCPTIFWLIYTSSALSVWILVLMTIERVLFTKFPMFAKRNMNRKNALIASTTLTVLISLFCCHVFVGQRLVVVTNAANVTVTKCTPTGEMYIPFATKVWPYIMFVVYNFLPMIIIFSGNMVILCSLRERRKVRANLQTQQNAGLSEKVDKETKATRLLFFLCFFFLITTTPFMLFGIIYGDIYKQLNDYEFAGIQLTYVMVKIFLWSNFTFNFFFYFINGSLFKREWDGLIRDVKLKIYRAMGKSTDAILEVATITARDASDTLDTRVH